MENNHIQKEKARYLAGLDGLRAVAVIAIIIYHLNPEWLPGGFLGVDTFFVISGYLITSLLLYEYRTKGTIDLKGFWIRRFKRLIPAAFFMITAVLTYTLFFEIEMIQRMKQDAVAAFFYVSNWWYIFQDVSYFDSAESQPLLHLWSLAIEEQFYLIWPLVFFLLIRKNKSMAGVFGITLLISLISLVIMVVLAEPMQDNSRVYFGTDTRLQTLLLGVMLAYIWPPFKLKRAVDVDVKRWIDGIGVVSLLILIYFFFTVNSSDYWIYFGGLYLISAVTLLLIASSVHPSTMLPKILGNPVFLWIGTRSYSLYLWHYPVIVLMNRHFIQGQIPWYIIIIEVIMTGVFAEVSYRFIETPIRKEGFRALWPVNKARIQAGVRTVVFGVFIIISGVVLTGIFDHHQVNLGDGKETEFVVEGSNESIVSIDEEGEAVNLLEEAPLLIGDSITVDIGEYISGNIPNATIDGAVGRQLNDTLELAREKYDEYKSKEDIVVLQLGTNGDFTDDTLHDLITFFEDADIYFVNTRVPRDWEGNVNEHIYDAAERYDNVTLVDWYTYSEGQNGYFANDGVHLLPEGVEALSNLIIDTIRDNHNPTKGEVDIDRNQIRSAK
ncbi:acyltransferase family protein [Corticicoccus populi]|uniref:Acyltransferase family protein n=1 Tax=Corticicoccus populi TaxID=1812821 RepID=A0ABW5WXC4_9STAP